MNTPHTQVQCSPQWLELQHALHFSLLMSSRSTGDLYAISTGAQANLNFQVQQFPLCMGMALHGNSLHIACQTDCRTYHDVLSLPGYSSPVHDRCFVPRAIHVTGDLDAHEMAVNEDGQPLLISSSYSCVGTYSATHSFKPVWQPKFISALLPEDRCHLNGLCVVNGQLKYVTLFAQTDCAAGWRNVSYDEGMIWDAVEQQAVCTGLTQPHSPRMYKGELYVLNSGAGEFGRVDLKTGRFDPIAYVGGYGRGLSFVGDYALFGISKPRHPHYQIGLKLHDRLKAIGAIDRCALLAVNIQSGEIVEGIEFHGQVRELFDTLVLENSRSAVVMGWQEASHPGLVCLDLTEKSPLVLAPA